MARTRPDPDPETAIVEEAFAAGRPPAPVTDDIVGMEQYDTLPRRILVVYLPLAAFVFVLLFPFYWMAITAIKPNHQLTNYIIPTSADAPPMAVDLVEIPYSRGPHGAKGVGELPMDAPAPAVLAAIAHATGVRLDEIPATPERLRRAWQSMHEGATR